ncbi:GL25509 [Drosophila persimilis]|uniref:GL25509 n=2 Tax=Drosophila persimilis TaxID=7234 RepID=B4GJG0_DROPE|nr:GL25509 [Drosophila persimilis]
MPKKPQHLSLASSTANSGTTANAGSSGSGSGSNKPKYSLTLHNSSSNKYATGGGTKNNPLATTTLRDNHHQRQHLKALRLTRDAAPGGSSDADYKRPTMTGLTGPTGGLSPGEDLVGVHQNRTLATMKPLASAAVNGEASTTNLTKSMANGMGNGSGMANGVIRTQNNRLWYH